MDQASGAASPEDLRIARVRSLLPELPEVTSFLELLVSTSRPDPQRRWTGSGALGTVGDRVVEPDRVRSRMADLIASETRQLAERHARLLDVVLALQGGDGERAVDLLLEQGREEEVGGRWRAAEAWYLSGASLARNLGSLRVPRAVRLAARTAWRLGQLEQAVRRYEEACTSADALGMEDELVIAATGRGNVAVDQGQWEEARAWYQRALVCIGESGEPRRERWQLLQNLAIVHRRTGDFPIARRCLEAASREGERLEDSDAEVEVANGWGQLLLAEGDARGAELHFREALSLAGTSRARVTIGVNLGEALLAQGRALEAAEEGRDAEALALFGGVVGKLPEVYRLLAASAHARGEQDAAVLLDRALDVIRDHGLPGFEEALTLEAGAALRRDGGEDLRAIGELERARQLFDEIGMQDAVQRIEQSLAALRPDPDRPVTEDEGGGTG